MQAVNTSPDFMASSADPSEDGNAVECRNAPSTCEPDHERTVDPTAIEWVTLVDVWNTDEMGFDEDDPERPIVIGGVPKALWDDLCSRVAAIRPSLVAGMGYRDGNICGADWWRSLNSVKQYTIASCLRQPRFLAEHGLRLIALPGTEVGGFALDVPL